MTIAILCIILIVSAVAFSFIQTTYGTALAFLALVFLLSVLNLI